MKFRSPHQSAAPDHQYLYHGKAINPRNGWKLCRTLHDAAQTEMIFVYATIKVVSLAVDRGNIGNGLVVVSKRNQPEIDHIADARQATSSGFAIMMMMTTTASWRINPGQFAFCCVSDW